VSAPVPAEWQARLDALATENERLRTEIGRARREGGESESHARAWHREVQQARAALGAVAALADDNEWDDILVQHEPRHVIRQDGGDQEWFECAGCDFTTDHDAEDRHEDAYLFTRHIVALLVDELRAVLAPVSGAVEGTGDVAAPPPADRTGLIEAVARRLCRVDGAWDEDEMLTSGSPEPYEAWNEYTGRAYEALDEIEAAGWSVAPVAKHEQEVRAETFEDELDAHIVESLADPEYLAAHNRAERADELRLAAAAIQALHPGEVKNSVVFLTAHADALTEGNPDSHEWLGGDR
jgi:hypothetical protein